MIIPEPFEHALVRRIINTNIQLGAVAGGDNRGFTNGRTTKYVLQRGVDTIRRKGNFLANINGGGFVVNAER